MANNFSHIYLPVRDVDASVEFYTKNFGFRLLRKYQATEGGSPAAYVELGDVLLELTKASRPVPADETRTEPRIGLAVDDIDATVAKLKAAGVPVEREPFEARTFWGRQAMIKDPSGYGVSLREWEAPDGPRYEDWQPRHEGGVRLA